MTGNGMMRIAGGTFLMGSEDFYPEERPVRRVTVGPFWMDAHPVTNSAFARFISETGYVTVAERPPDPVSYPGIDPAALVPGSLVFRAPPPPVVADFRAWWTYMPGASWARPEGPDSSILGRENHPVVHVAYADAAAFAAWAGKDLPSEAEWEYAARGGLEGAIYVWGGESTPGGRHMANTWQGEFPWQNLKLDGFEGTSPVKAFLPNGYGLFDMAGNVWEWTNDHFSVPAAEGGNPCCVPGDSPVMSADTQMPAKVVKGGSHLCAPNYCLRYRPAARQPQEIDSSASHIGFRCIIRGA